MERHKGTLILLLAGVVGLAASLLLIGLTLCQVYILASWQGMPPVWQQLLFFIVLLLAGGAVAGRMSTLPDLTGGKCDAGL